MRICFVSKGTLGEFREQTKETKETENETLSETERADIVLFGFGGGVEVSYERELKGETNYFEEAALLSKSGKNIVVCGYTTIARGHKRRSVRVAENGRLAGVSDMLNVIDGECAIGAALRVYETKAGRMGVVVAEDLNFPDVVRSLAICGSDFIVCPFGRSENVHTSLLRAHAYCYGVPIFFCADGYCMIADVSGAIAFASPQSPVFADFKPRKQYHLVETRHRGLFRE